MLIKFNNNYDNNSLLKDIIKYPTFTSFIKAIQKDETEFKPNKVTLTFAKRFYLLVSSEKALYMAERYRKAKSKNSL